MKIIKSISKVLVVLLLALLILPIGVSAKASNLNEEMHPEKMNIIVTNYVGNFYFDNYVVKVKKISTPIGPGYCLNLKKDYPSGEIFDFNGKGNVQEKQIMAHGYPSKSLEELGVYTEDEAYLATQAALWCLYEGFDVQVVTTKNYRVDEAMKSIYYATLRRKAEDLNSEIIVYTPADPQVQDILVFKTKSVEVKPEVKPEGEFPTGK